VQSLRRIACELGIPERTLRRAASEGLLRGERLSPRRFQVSLLEESYLRKHWPLLRSLRGALRTEPNVRLAVLFGSTATGTDEESFDIDVLVALHDSDLRRLAELSERLTRALAREVHLARLSETQASPAGIVDVLEHGRVLVDRDDLWSELQRRAPRWRRLARRAQRSLPVALDALAQAGAPAAAKPHAWGVFDGPGDLSQDVDGHLARTGFGES
jgi:predicted nucleotidyltransferase